MTISRGVILPALAALAVLIYALSEIVAGWGTITIDEEGVPLSKVLRSIEKQGHVEIVTNADLTQLVSLSFRRVSLTEALQYLSDAVEGRWSLVGVLAPDKGSVLAVKGLMRDSSQPEGWTMTSRPLPPMFSWMTAENATGDPRSQTWTPGTDTGVLPWPRAIEVLAEGADITIITPAEWTPGGLTMPAGGSVEKVVQKVASTLKGESDAFVYLRVRKGEGDGNGRMRSRDGFWGGGSGDFAWQERRVEQQISQLPEDKRASMREAWNEQKNLMAELQALPPEQRRERMMQYFQDPVVQDRMEEMRETRDSRRTPESRRDRYRGYLGNKAAAKGNS